MRPQDFKRWRKALSFSQKEAAEALGLKRRVVQYYEKGERGGVKVKIPKTVRLACAALSGGVADYQGPEKPAESKGAGKKPNAKKASTKKADSKKPETKKAASKSKAKAADKPAAKPRRSGKTARKAA
jgi:transcriptional regulator with XRE-family HTH domain